MGNNTNDYVPFAVGQGANTLSPSDYGALPAVQTGFQSGAASSKQVNTALRQLSVVAAALAQLTADYGNSNVKDDGNVAKLEAQILVALRNVTATTSAPGIPYEGEDKGETSNAIYVDVTNPASTALAAGQLFLITKSGNSLVAGTTTFKNGSNAPVPLKTLRGNDPIADDWIARQPALIYIISVAGSLQAALLTLPRFSVVHYGDDVSTTANQIVVSNLTPTVSSYGKYRRYQIILANDLTGPGATVKLAGLSTTRTLLRADGSPVQAGDAKAGWVLDVVDDGNNLRLAGVSLTAVAVLSLPKFDFSTVGSGNVTVPAGCTVLELEGWGCGGGGGGVGSPNNGAGCGGGGGTYGFKRFTGLVPGQLLSWYIGPGGTAGGQGGTGGTGGMVSFGGSCSINGGTGGTPNGGGGIGGTPGAATGWDATTPGGVGGAALTSGSAQGGMGGGGGNGGGCGGAGAAGVAAAGVVPGGGGGGGGSQNTNGTFGGAGACGRLRGAWKPQ